MGGYHLKDPGAVLDYRVEWGAAVAGGVALAASEWAVEPAEAGGLEHGGGAVAGTATSIRLSGGIAGRVYRATNRVTFSDGSVDERMLVVRVEER